MNIYTYFYQDESLPESKDLLPIWKSAWEAVGFNPIVISEEPVNHTKFSEVLGKVKSLPNKNPQKYSENNFLRWLAAGYLAGDGALFVDSDLFPTCSFDISCLEALPKGGDIVILDSYKCPCAVWLNQRGCDILCNAILNVDSADCEHYCDQEMFRDSGWISLDLVGTWPNSDKPLIHIATYHLIEKGEISSPNEKAEWIKKNHNNIFKKKNYE